MAIPVTFDESFGFSGFGELNEVIESSEGRFQGNWFYAKGLEKLNAAPLAEEFVLQRHNLRLAYAGRKRMLELGICGGHAALMALGQNPALQWDCIDPCNLRYDLDAGEWLAKWSPARFRFFTGDSMQILPELRIRGAGTKYDIVSIDAKRPLEAVRTDIFNALSLMKEGALLLMDGREHPQAGAFLDQCVTDGFLLNGQPSGWRPAFGQLCAKINPLLARCFP